MLITNGIANVNAWKVGLELVVWMKSFMAVIYTEIWSETNKVI